MTLAGGSLIFLAFVVLYWTQTKPLQKGANDRTGRAQRWSYAFDFARRTALELGYGRNNSRDGFRVITTIHSVGFKLIAFRRTLDRCDEAISSARYIFNEV